MANDELGMSVWRFVRVGMEGSTETVISLNKDSH